MLIKNLTLIKLEIDKKEITKIFAKTFDNMQESQINEDKLSLIEKSNSENEDSLTLEPTYENYEQKEYFYNMN